MKKKKALPKFLFGPVTNRIEEVVSQNFVRILAKPDGKPLVPRGWDGSHPVFEPFPGMLFVTLEMWEGTYIWEVMQVISENETVLRYHHENYGNMLPEEVLTSKYGYLLALCDTFHRYSGTYHA